MRDFIEAPGSLEQLQEIGRRAPPPNVANMIEGGKTPVLGQEQLAALGFHLILYPLAGLYASARAVQAVYQKLRAAGTTLDSGVPQMSFAEFNELIGVEEKYALIERLGEQ